MQCNDINSNLMDGEESQFFKWNKEFRDLCYNALLVNADDLSSTIANMDIASQDGMDLCINNFTQCLTNVTAPFFKQMPKVKAKLKRNSQNQRVTTDKPWKKNQRKCDLNITDFFEYFKELVSSAPNSNKRPEVINNECVFDELDADITADEIIKAIYELKMDKSHGPDCLLNEFFIEYKDFIIPHLCTIFNAVLISGYFPSSWSDAILVPIFKSGDANDAANYRGISLVKQSR
ncbi:Hypothetical predicted protein [Mytilus galloprovincialis]|uniref:Reverse transcriptase domain-containing protein n=1 Tax=Mytilus galloprovincialis TaxID=29158 RepID=A0A8B6G0R9_MYTGA|nr:Hypothetical predicted protein [Mytilus galloprovincialis]